MTASVAADGQLVARLAPWLQEHVRLAGWTALRPIQREAWPMVWDSEADLLLVAGTAGGKTEAIVLPILTQLATYPAPAIGCLYVAPLKALLNDQHDRLANLAQDWLRIEKWHGDVDYGRKRLTLRRPPAVLQITPESLDSLLIRRPGELAQALRGLRYVVVDELHAFLGTDRGVQLRSVLARVAAYLQPMRPRYVGLSATVGSPRAAAAWLAPDGPERVRVIDVSSGRRAFEAEVVPVAGANVSAVVDDVYEATRLGKAIVFTNARRDVETLTDQLNQRCRREGRREQYLAHHGSVARDLRTEAEKRLRHDLAAVTVVATTTLELGIDVGDLDQVLQFGVPFTVSGFLQRLGRSGRREGRRARTRLYVGAPAEDESEPIRRLPFDVLHALAVVLLARRGWVEPTQPPTHPFNVVLHQVLSMVAERGSFVARDLAAAVIDSGAFRSVEPEALLVLFHALCDRQLLEVGGDQRLRLGELGERLIAGRDFLAVFETPVEWHVQHGATAIGRITPTVDLKPGATLVLAGRRWVVEHIETSQRVVHVLPSADRGRPEFRSQGVPLIADDIGAAMLEIVQQGGATPDLDASQAEQAAKAAAAFQQLGCERRVWLEDERGWHLLTWSGSRTTRTIGYVLDTLGFRTRDAGRLFPWVVRVMREGVLGPPTAALTSGATRALTLEAVVGQIPPSLLATRKYDDYVPDELLRARAAAADLNLPAALAVLREVARPLSAATGAATGVGRRTDDH